MAFSKATGSELFFDATLVREKTSPGARGRLTREEALARILTGAGLTYRISGNAVIISESSTTVDGSLAEDGSLVLDTIEVGGSNAANLPFETPGSTNFISGQELERFPGLTAGSIFQGTPGVISGSSNNGASIDPNIRGLQGMNRIATTIDGSQQSTSTYRGYAGVDNRTYVDPDLISGITVTKGPDGSVGGAIGGTIAMETLGIADILKPGDTYGVRARIGLNTNGTGPVIGQTDADLATGGAENRTGSLAAAVTTTNVDVIAAYVRRTNGNYSAGTEGDLTIANQDGQQERLSNYGYGQQVFNTSEDVTSGLLKTVLRPADGHELELAYLYYGNAFGEVSPSAIASGNNVTWQLPLSSVNVNQATARYHFKPYDNDLIDFRLNSYVSSVDETNIYALSGTIGEIEQQSRNFGVNLENVSRFAVADTPVALRYGGSYTMQSARPLQSYDAWMAGWAMPANSDQQIGTLFGKVKWEPLSWLALETGVEYLTYNTQFTGKEPWTNTGPDFTGYSGQGVSPSASVTVTPLPGWQLYVQYQSGIRPPSVREVSYTRGEQNFNPDLVAETASNWEVGTNLLRNDIFRPGDLARLKLAYFDNTTDDYIGRQFSANRMTFFNYDYVRFQGVEISGGYDAGFAFVDVGFNYYTGFESCLKDGACTDYTLQADYLTNQIPPKFTASITAGARFLDDRVTVGGRLTYVGDRLAPVVKDPTYQWVTTLWAPYTVVDLFGQWKINDILTFDVSVQNLFDTYYVDALNNTDMPAPGRVIRGSLTAKLGGADTTPWRPFGRPASARNMPWTGFYAGAQFGYGIGSITGTTTAADGTATPVTLSESADQDLANMLAGGQIGFNYQFSNGLVLGVEGDFSWTGIQTAQDALAIESSYLSSRQMLQAHTVYDVDWLATIRARAGYAWDRTFLYATAGVAFMKETETRTQYRSDSVYSYLPDGSYTERFFSETASNVRTGYAAGAGMEYAIADNWSLKLEYMFTGFGAESFNFKNARSGVTKSYTTSKVVGTYKEVRHAGYCASRGGIFCQIIDKPIYEKLGGTSEVANGRDASNSANLQMIKIGLNYRF
ncbi:TonB-dependent receptor domain-containing protein [Ancylobacter sp. SL191]|uniref:TonB-dependent receptor domain-containing protein n=1 Tax=Ancylobacter sp. SL191 TaxID=2995166 RepID=UPI00227218B5|nr:TonB-dependent receptor [Ancylobacter sp. SL191]WAC27545.1 TonB-dependent receptor [Ancylobacter sp. SL191]